MAVPLLTGREAPEPPSAALRQDLTNARDDVARFYQTRHFRPVWIRRGQFRPEAHALVSALAQARSDNLDPQRYHASEDAALTAKAPATRADAAKAELELSRDFAAYVADLHQPRPDARLRYADPAAAAPSFNAYDVLMRLARAPTLARGLHAALATNPLYRHLREAWLKSLDRHDPHARTALIEVNMDRARALPPNLGPRFILVDPAAETLWYYDRGAAVGSMRVVVGKPSQATPSMIGVMRYALFNPYWNMPPDLVRDRVVPAVLEEGPGYLKSHRFEALSDWTANAQTLDPNAIDWNAVAAGAPPPRIRQLPGADNAMGQVKFMLPNPLGVYLHDTPQKAFFAAARRMESAGCVRLQHPQQLAAWLFGHPVSYNPAGPPDQRVDLPAWVPVYIVYLTATVGSNGGVQTWPDLYRRDPAALAGLSATAS